MTAPSSPSPAPVAGRRLAFAFALAFFVAAGSISCSTSGPRGIPAPPAGRAPADELYELSPLRVQLRRLAPQAIRLLAPHWSRVRESDRKALQATLVSTLAPERMAPFVRGRLRQAVDAHPDLAGAVLEWLRSPLGYEVKFAEATAWSGDKSPEDSFYADVADVKAERTPEIRMERIRRLADATGALERTIDLTRAVGLVMARLANVARPGTPALALPRLAAEVQKESRVPDVREAYAPVVRAALLVRCRDLDLQDLDAYIAFSSSAAGRWYHETLVDALAFGVERAAMDVEGVFEHNAHSDVALPSASGFDLDSLVVDLGAGRSVRLLALARTGPESEPALLLRYETDLPMRNAAAIHAEAKQVWDRLRGQIGGEGARAAVLQATGSVEGWVFPFASSRKFAWTRREAGEWMPLAEAGGTFGKLEREMLWSVPP